MTQGLARFLRLRHLALVQALAQHGTMHQAARVLNMTQSTASKMLKDLEDIMGAPLFFRDPRGMRCTDLGRFALLNAEDILNRMDRFAEEFELRKQGGYGLLSLGAIMGAAPDLVAKAVATLKHHRPLLSIRMLGETSDNILYMLERGEIDLAVGRFATNRQRTLFSFEPLADEAMVLAVRAGHPLSTAADQAPDLAELVQWPWILQPKATPTRGFLETVLAERNLEEPTNCVESVSIFAILHLLQTSDALALLPYSVVRDHLHMGLLASLPNPIGQSIPEFGILLRRNEPLSEVAAEFRDILRRVSDSQEIATAPGSR
ncbi:LysR family transcriptional regulator [Rhodospirillum sp. A1_3_36]|uniref:LysR family transcriptional regulator n=1 Tax=Rhodospirillum sp. A1_3_36 TaxID=3391666 RepID=UPI0039A4E4B3